MKDAFFANYLTALLFLRLQDLKGLRLINDHSGASLNKFTGSMSDINFWGKALFLPVDPEIKKRMVPGGPEHLHIESGRIALPRVHAIMAVPLTAPERVNWHDVIAMLVLLRHRYSVDSSYFKNVLYYLYTWDHNRDSDKKRAISQAVMYLMQSDPQSSLLSRVRELNSTTMLGKFVNFAGKLVGFQKVTEDDAGGTSAGNIGSMSSGGNAIISPPNMSPTVNSDSPTTEFNRSVLGGLYRLKKLSPVQVTKKGKYIFKDGKIIKKKAKKFVPRHIKRPEGEKHA